MIKITKKLRSMLKEFKYEKYLYIFTIREQYKNLIKDIKTLIKLPLNQRFCDECNVLEDEFNYIIICKKFPRSSTKKMFTHVTAKYLKIFL